MTHRFFGSLTYARLALAMLGLGLTAPTANAADAYTLVSAANGTAVFVDFPSITKAQIGRDGAKEAWTLWVYDHERLLNQGHYSYQLSQDYYSCADATSAPSDIMSYTQADTVMDNSVEDEPEFMPVPPDAASQAVQKAVCTGKSALAQPATFAKAHDAVAYGRKLLGARGKGHRKG